MTLFQNVRSASNDAGMRNEMESILPGTGLENFRSETFFKRFYIF